MQSSCKGQARQSDASHRLGTNSTVGQTVNQIIRKEEDEARNKAREEQKLAEKKAALKVKKDNAKAKSALKAENKQLLAAFEKKVKSSSAGGSAVAIPKQSNSRAKGGKKRREKKSEPTLAPTSTIDDTEEVNEALSTPPLKPISGILASILKSAGVK